MTQNPAAFGGQSPSPPTPRPLRHPSEIPHRVMSARQLREHGVSTARARARCGPDGPWQMPLPGVYLLRSGEPSGEERLQAALCYAESRTGATAGGGMVTGLAALALHGFGAVPDLAALERVEVLVERTRRLRSTSWVRIVRGQALPRPVERDGFPVAPVARALADAVAGLPDAAAVHRLLSEAVRGAFCEPQAVVVEFRRARLLSRPHVVRAVDTLLAEGRALAEDRLRELVREGGLPDPLWNVDLRLPGGPQLGGVDAYWPEEAVAVEIDAREARQPEQVPRQQKDALWSEYARKREAFERLGITVLHLTPAKLRDAWDQQATVVRTALLDAAEREPAAYIMILPR